MRKKARFIFPVLIVLLIINKETETIPYHFNLKYSSKSDFSVMCYNVKCSDILYRDNQVEIAKLILRESPDIVFLCEFNLSKSKKLDSIMLESREYKQYYRSKSNCIFYSKYEIDSINGIDTQTTSGVRAKNNMVHVFHPKGVVTIVGCHLSSSRKDILGGYRYRKIEADSIYKALECEKSPIIVMGDLNDVSGSYTINKIKKAGLTDAWWEGGCSYGATFHGNGLLLRIDHILYEKNRLKLQCIKVIDSDLSDHNALIASFSFR